MTEQMPEIKSGEIIPTEQAKTPEILENLEENKKETLEVGTENGEALQEAILESALEGTDREISTQDGKIKAIEEQVGEIQQKLDRARGELGLPSREEKPPSIEAYEKELTDLRQQKEIFEAQKHEFQEKLAAFKDKGIEEIPKIDIDKAWEEAVKEDAELERRAEVERDKLMQEKIDKLYEEFQNLSEKEQVNLIQVGVMVGGGAWQSGPMGKISPENAKEFAKGFKEGKKDLAYYAGVLGKIVGMLARAVWQFAKGVALGLMKK